MSVKLHR